MTSKHLLYNLGLPWKHPPQKKNNKKEEEGPTIDIRKKYLDLPIAAQALVSYVGDPSLLNS